MEWGKTILSSLEWGKTISNREEKERVADIISSMVKGGNYRGGFRLDRLSGLVENCRAGKK